jgi:hypothetical protein
VKKTTGEHWRHPEINFGFGLLFEDRFISEEQATLDPVGIDASRDRSLCWHALSISSTKVSLVERTRFRRSLNERDFL